jgi:hypothetical protein
MGGDGGHAVRLHRWLLGKWMTWRGWRAVALLGGRADGDHVLLAPREPAPERLFWAHQRSHIEPCPAHTSALYVRRSAPERYLFQCEVDSSGARVD